MAYGSITQRGDKYRVCFDYGVDRNGKRVRKYRTFDTKRDADRANDRIRLPRYDRELPQAAVWRNPAAKVGCA